METVTLLYILIAVIVALFLASFQYIFHKKEKSQLNYWLSFLRFLSFFCIFLLIINPSIQKEELSIEKPNLLVAVDNSLSIQQLQQEVTVQNVLKKLKDNKELNSKFDIHYYSFGSNVQVLDTLSFTEAQTNISIPLIEFSKLYKNSIKPTVVISDGNQTNGSSINFLNLKDPIYPVIVGDTTAIEDIYISQINVNKYTYINNKFPVELFVNYIGEKTEIKELAIFNQGEKIASKRLNFNKEINTHNVSFFLSGNKKGRQYYTARISSLENEINTKNNTKNFSVEVVEEQSKILLLSSLNHPDLGMIKKSIETNKQRKVDIENVKDENINISDYQLVILYQPSNHFKNIFDVILNGNSNYLVISGTKTDWNFLNEVQDVFQKEIVLDSENYLPKFNENYATFMSEDIGFSSFSPLEDSFGNITFSIPYQTLLFKKIGAITTEQPLLATFENFGQKGAVLLGENSWRWRMNSYVENKSFELFDGFMSGLIQYLSSNFKNSRLSVQVKPMFYANENVVVHANYLDKNLNVNTKAKLWITVSDIKNNYINKTPLALINTRFETDISNLEPSEYSYSITVENSEEKLSGSFKVLPYQVEEQFSRANSRELEKIAVLTEGTLFYSNQENDLISTLLNDNRYKSIQKSTTIKTPLIEWSWLLGLIILFLSLEWFIRKYYGKI